MSQRRPRHHTLFKSAKYMQRPKGHQRKSTQSLFHTKIPLYALGHLRNVSMKKFNKPRNLEGFASTPHPLNPRHVTCNGGVSPYSRHGVAYPCIHP